MGQRFDFKSLASSMAAQVVSLGIGNASSRGVLQSTQTALRGLSSSLIDGVVHGRVNLEAIAAITVGNVIGINAGSALAERITLATRVPTKLAKSSSAEIVTKHKDSIAEEKSTGHDSDAMPSRASRVSSTIRPDAPSLSPKPLTSEERLFIARVKQLADMKLDAKLDPDDVYTRYRAGEFDREKIPTTSKSVSTSAEAKSRASASATGSRWDGFRKNIDEFANSEVGTTIKRTGNLVAKTILSVLKHYLLQLYQITKYLLQAKVTS